MQLLYKEVKIQIRYNLEQNFGIRDIIEEFVQSKVQRD